MLAVNGGRALLANEQTAWYDPVVDRGRDVPVSGRPQRLTLGETVSDFVLTCFYLDFNGEFVRLVQVDKRIEPFEGLRAVKNLRFVPIEYVDAQAFRVGHAGAGAVIDSGAQQRADPRNLEVQSRENQRNTRGTGELRSRSPDEMDEEIFFKSNAKKRLRPWNGRQIRNACQTAAALAEFQNNGEVWKISSLYSRMPLTFGADYRRGASSCC